MKSVDRISDSCRLSLWRILLSIHIVTVASAIGRLSLFRPTVSRNVTDFVAIPTCYVGAGIISPVIITTVVVSTTIARIVAVVVPVTAR